MHIKPKKRLGQNFLFDKNIQRKIISACELKPSDSVLEIGSGRGELTKLIAQHVSEVYAIEIDSYLYEILKDNLKRYTNVKIINQDLLELDFKRYFGKLKNKIKIVGNIPYYITTPIIEYLLKYRNKIEAIFITVQKEFAQRITAKPGSKDYGSFSCFVQYYTKAQRLFFIKKTSFFPMPKVDSALLRLETKEKAVSGIKAKNERLLFKIIRAAFNKRRKTLKNSLAGLIPLQKLEQFFEKYNINSNIRPEELSLEDFVNLANSAL